VHRDIKPGNLMVAKDGRPVVLDFGLAHADEGDGLSLTLSTDVLGTPYYMAPEQLRRESRGVDRRTDVYSLGVTLFECLTRRRPFDAVSREALFRQILTVEPPAPRGLNPRIPGDLEVVVLTALDKDSDRRYQSALDFAEDLRRVRQFEPIRAKPISAMGRLWRWSRRHPAIAGSVSFAMLSLFAGIIVSLVLLREAKLALDREQSTRAELYHALSIAVASDDVRGRFSPMQPRLLKSALEQIDREDSGFEYAEETRWTTTARLKTLDQRCRSLIAVRDRLGGLASICASDLLHMWARVLLFTEAAAEYGPAVVEYAQVALAWLRGVESTDVRLIRARILLLDALLQRGTSEDLAAAAQHAESWIAERSPDAGRDPTLTALYESRLGGALMGLKQIPRAKQMLERSIKEVTRRFPHTFIANGAMTNLLALYDEEGQEVKAQGLRVELGESLALSLSIAVVNRHYGFPHSRAAVGPNRREIWTWMQKIVLERRKLSQSQAKGLLADCKRLCKKIADDDPVMYLVARALMIAGINQGNVVNEGYRYPGVGQIFQRAIRILRAYAKDPKDRSKTSWVAWAFSLGPLGHHYNLRGELESSEKTFREGRDLCPRDNYNWWMHSKGLGDCFSRQGRFPEAKPLLLESYTVISGWLGPSDGNTLVTVQYLIALYRRWGKLDEAVRWHGRFTPSSSERYLAETYVQFGKYRLAEIHLERGLRDLPSDKRAFFLRAQIKLLEKDYDLAIHHAKAVVGLGFSRGHRVWAQALFAKGMSSEAVPHFKLAAESPRFRRIRGDGFWSDYGAALAAHEDVSAGRDLLNELVEECPLEPLAWHARARFLATCKGLTTEDRAEAVRSAKKASEWFSDRRALLLAGLAEAQFRADDLPAARATATRVLSLMDGDAQWLTLAEARRRLKFYGGKEPR
jgi:tetratricopeptide (TPR) repeat protein